MEDQNFGQQSQSPSGGVSFPMVGEPQRKNNGAKTLLIAGILILVGILGFVIFKSASKKSDVISIESTNNDTELTTPPVQTNTPTSTPSSTSTPKAANKSAITIDVQNGTGVPGEAAYLQTQLKDLGYTKVSVGNATSQDASITTVTFSKTVAQDIVDEITKKLQSIYQEVTVKSVTSQLSDVVIVTGTRKGATSTAKPLTSGTPKASSTPKASPSASPKPSATP